MTVHEALGEGIKALRYLAIPTAELDAEVLLMHCLRTSHTDLLERPARIVAPSKLALYQEAILRRGEHEPVAYLTGRKEFFGREFVVTRDVLIPRPESELLVEEALRRIPPDRHAVVADIGTGSGCLGVTIAAERPRAQVIATDISREALRIAHTNAIRHRVVSRIEFVAGDFLHAVVRRHLDLVVANLPYVPEHEVRSNPDLLYEPIMALRGRFGPAITLATFLAQWYERSQRPVTLIEIHPDQAGQVLRENDKIGVAVRLLKDLAGRDRLCILEVRYDKKKAGVGSLTPPAAVPPAASSQARPQGA